MSKLEDRLSDELSMLACGMLGVVRECRRYEVTEEFARNLYELTQRARRLERRVEELEVALDLAGGTVRAQAPIEDKVIQFPRARVVTTDVLTAGGDCA